MSTHDHRYRDEPQQGRQRDALVIDPVCRTSVDPATARHKADVEGRTYYFCSSGCREKFVSDPQKYLARAATAPAPPREGTIYACPMHPQIRQSSPGNCPICGMTLEPEMPSVETEPESPPSEAPETPEPTEAPRGPSTPARCTRRSGSPALETAQSAE